MIKGAGVTLWYYTPFSNVPVVDFEQMLPGTSWNKGEPWWELSDKKLFSVS